ncbi:MAG TPA: 50S ribosomal protein L11 methyltransferase [Burkholderiales bacterium]|nr:50S ribosomal protein L11 methyltransferase [Burkholderiales bacterium]
MLSISFDIAAAEVEALTDALLEAGACSVDVAEAAPAGALPRARRMSRVSALVAEGADPAALLARACARAGLEPPAHELHRVEDRDWVRETQAQFVPIRISERLWIVPSWCQAPDPGAINVTLDPGLAFGTGGHASTRLALRWLEREIRGGESVLDYGCGSGILAIAALKLGAARAQGVDIDPQALLAARRNALHNRVQASFHGAAEQIREPARIVVANILAQPLIVLAPLLARLTAPGGRLALSGLLAAQAREVSAAYREWFEIGVGQEEEGWVLLAGTRREG